MGKFVHMAFVLVSMSIVSCSAQNKAPDAVTYQGIIFKPEYVKIFPENIEFEGKKITFKKINEVNIDVDKNQSNDLITLYNCEGWESDPGDFRRILIKMDGGKNLEIKNMGGWIKVPEQFKEYYENPHLLLLNIGFTKPILVLFGYQYESEPGYLTLVSINQDKAELIFNEKFEVLRILKTGDDERYKLIGIYKGKNYELFIEKNELRFLPQ